MRAAGTPVVVVEATTLMEGVVAPVGAALDRRRGGAVRLRGAGAEAGRVGLCAGRSGRRCRRFLRARGDHRCVPGHRALSGADRVLGRRGREPAQLLGLLAALSGSPGERAPLRRGRRARRDSGERRVSAAGRARMSSRPIPRGPGPRVEAFQSDLADVLGETAGEGAYATWPEVQKGLAEFPAVTLSSLGLAAGDQTSPWRSGPRAGSCRSPICRRLKRRSAGWWTTATGW